MRRGGHGGEHSGAAALCATRLGKWVGPASPPRYAGRVLKLLDLRQTPDAFAAFLARDEDDTAAATDTVRGIIAAVRADGDDALRRLTEQFDSVVLGELRVGADAIEAAWAAQPLEVQAALEDAAARIRRYHEAQVPGPVVHAEDGVRITERAVPVARAGLYVPGGRAAYPSTVLMTAIPAQVAGVHERVLCVPPGPDGVVPAVTLAAAKVAGIETVIAVGGAQAVAAMAYGTASVPTCDVIVGPGNRYVALAKREVSGVVHVESMAGPSEVAIVCDATADPMLVALDVCAQAEHGPGGTAVVVTWDAEAASAVVDAIDTAVADAPRRADITATLTSGGVLVVVPDVDAALDVVNALAPEHLEVMCAGAEIFAERVRNAGAIFVGPDAPAALGDYAVGTNHVLPTGRAARYASALRVDDFLKHIHIVAVEPAGLAALAPTVTTLAEAEGLPAHAASVRARLDRSVGTPVGGE